MNDDEKNSKYRKIPNKLHRQKTLMSPVVVLLLFRYCLVHFTKENQVNFVTLENFSVVLIFNSFYDKKKVFFLCKQTFSIVNIYHCTFVNSYVVI